MTRGPPCVIRISPNSPRWRASEPSSDSSAHSSGGDLTRVREAWSERHGGSFRHAADPSSRPCARPARSRAAARPARARGRRIGRRRRAAGRGLQAQDAPAAALGVRARLAGDDGLGGRRTPASRSARSPGRGCMRGTLHLIPAEDARWMVALLGPIGLRKSARRIARAARRAAGGDRRRSARRWRTGRCTRREIADAVRARGVDRLADDPQVPAWLTGVAALQGRDHRGRLARTRADVRAHGRLARPGRPGCRTATPRRRARPPPRPRPPARRRRRTSRPGRASAIGDARRAYAAIARSSRRSRCSAARAWVPHGPRARAAARPPAAGVRRHPARPPRPHPHPSDPEHDKRGPAPAAASSPPRSWSTATSRAPGSSKRGRADVTPFGDPPDYADEVADVERFRTPAGTPRRPRASRRRPRRSSTRSLSAGADRRQQVLVARARPRAAPRAACRPAPGRGSP